MKYIKYKIDTEEKIGVLENSNVYELNYSSILNAIKDEEDIIKNNFKNNKSYKINEVKILPPINPTKVVCIGLNYKDHAKEFNMKLPQEPLLFIKPSTSIIANKEYIHYPDDTEKLDFEAELGIIILDKATKDNIDQNHIAGYTIINDVTARDLQEKDGQWTRSKGYDTFCPCGPVIVTNINPLNLKIKSEVNNKIKQDSNTKNMIFSPRELVNYISKIMTLNPGDIIATGTPPGVDHLQKGDEIKITIEKIGILKNTVK